MITGQRTKLPQVNLETKPMEAALRECYGREMRSMQFYEDQCSQPEYAHVFSHIRDQERQHCRMVLELIGSMRTG
jgi:rubrerythrin